MDSLGIRERLFCVLIFCDFSRARGRRGGFFGVYSGIGSCIRLFVTSVVVQKASVSRWKKYLSSGTSPRRRGVEVLSTMWAGGAARAKLGEGAITDRCIRATAIRGRLGAGIARNDRRGEW